METISLYGAYLSSYVRKTRLVLAYKNLQYQHISVSPKMSDPPAEFEANSPLGKIPLARVGDCWLPDSSVICAWAERAVPEPALLPSDNFAAARALWYEEYADTRMTQVIGGHLFAERILARSLFKREPIQADIDAAIGQEIPEICEYLNGELQGDYLLGEQFTLADIAVCSLFVTMQHCQEVCDAERWPQLAAYIDRVIGGELFKPVVNEEKQILASLSNI